MNPFIRDMGRKSLILLPVVFRKLHTELINQFLTYYSIETKTLLDYQLYGFDQYDESSPNLKTFIFSKTNILVNGKYLYNKVRENKNGREEIKLTREYTTIYFNALGFKDIHAFMNSTIFDDKDREAQLQLEVGGLRYDNFDDEYYVGYYYGEDSKIIKTKLIIYNNYQDVDWVLVYWENENEPSRYTYKGIVTEVRGTLAFYFSIENSTIERNVLITVFFGNRNIINKPFLQGVYSGFDRNNCPVAGKIIFQKVDSSEELEAAVLFKQVDAIISNEITGKRLRVDSILAQNMAELAEDTICANSLTDYSGKYRGLVVQKGSEKVEEVRLTVGPPGNKSTLSFVDNGTYNGNLRLVCRGDVISGYFNLNEPYDRINLTLDANFHGENYLLGVYSGMNKFNCLMCGKICLKLINFDGEWLDEQQELSHTALNNFTQLNFHPQFITKFLFENQNQVPKSQVTVNGYGKNLIVEDDSILPIIRMVSGVYEMYNSDGNKDYVIKSILNIEDNGKVTIKSLFYLYHGNAIVFGDGILSINITLQGHKEFYGHFLVYVGRHDQDAIKALSGTYNTLDNDYSPMAQKVFLVKNNEKFETQNSEKLKIKSKSINVLSKRIPNFKDFLDSSYEDTVRTKRCIN